MHPQEFTLEDIFSRYLMQRGDFAKSNWLVKHGAFQPWRNPKTGQLQTSVYHTSGLSAESNWKLGHKIAEKRKRSLKARADIKARRVGEEGLTIDYDNDPERHALIIGWPESKSKRRHLAQQLGRHSQLVMAPVRS